MSAGGSERIRYRQKPTRLKTEPTDRHITIQPPVVRLPISISLPPRSAVSRSGCVGVVKPTFRRPPPAGNVDQHQQEPKHHPNEQHRHAGHRVVPDLLGVAIPSPKTFSLQKKKKIVIR